MGIQNGEGGIWGVRRLVVEGVLTQVVEVQVRAVALAIELLEVGE